VLRIGPLPTADEHWGADRDMPPGSLTRIIVCRTEDPVRPETGTASAAWTPVMARVASPTAAVVPNAGLTFLLIPSLPARPALTTIGPAALPGRGPENRVGFAVASRSMLGSARIGFRAR
jgi:hypothetical protein